MTRLITQNQVPKIILDSMINEVASSLKNNEPLDVLKVFDDISHCFYILYIVENESNELEEIYFISDDVVSIDYRIKKSKFRAFPMF